MLDRVRGLRPWGLWKMVRPQREPTETAPLLNASKAGFLSRKKRGGHRWQMRDQGRGGHLPDCHVLRRPSSTSFRRRLHRLNVISLTPLLVRSASQHPDVPGPRVNVTNLLATTGNVTLDRVVRHDLDTSS